MFGEDLLVIGLTDICTGFNTAVPLGSGARNPVVGPKTCCGGATLCSSEGKKLDR